MLTCGERNGEGNYTRRISSCRELDYLEHNQRRHERYIIIHTWKIANGLATNDIGMTFKDHTCQGLRAIIPPLNNKAQRSVATHYDNSIAVKAARLWNILP